MFDFVLSPAWHKPGYFAGRKRGEMKKPIKDRDSEHRKNYFVQLLKF